MYIQLICTSSFIKHAFKSRVVDSIYPDQPDSQKLADLDPHCFQNRIYLALRW